MADEVTDDRVAMKAYHDRSVIPGAVVMALGLLVLAVAAVEYFVFSDIAGSTDGGNDLFGLSFGTTAYLAGYTAAGVILIAVGIWKIYRAR
jgi:hypothetical protein